MQKLNGRKKNIGRYPCTSNVKNGTALTYVCVLSLEGHNMQNAIIFIFATHLYNIGNHIYSRLSLSQLRKLRYLKEKIWSFFLRRNLTSGNKILWIREELLIRSHFSPFP